MKKLLSVFITAALLMSMICPAGIFSVSAVEDEETAVNYNEIEDESENDSDGEIAADGDAVYSVIGNCEDIFYNTDDIYDKTTEMTYDSRVGLYKYIFRDVQPINDVRIKIVKNHSVKEDFDIQSTYFIFDVVSACDVLVTFDYKTGITNVLGDGVVPFNVKKVVLLGFGNKAFNWDYFSDDNYLTEVESGVWEITCENVMTSSDPYCQVYFGVNPTGVTIPTSSFGFGNANNEIVSSGVETDAAILGSRNIAFKVEKNYSTVNLRLDIRNFDSKTKTGAKFTVTVTPPESEPVFSMVRKSNLDAGVPNPETIMTYNPDTYLYECNCSSNTAQQNQQIYVWKNHGTDGKYGAYGSYKPETAFCFDVLKSTSYKVTFDPETEQIDVIGDGVLAERNFSVKSVTAAGNGSGSYLNGKYWDASEKSNMLKETSRGVWETTYEDVSAGDLYQLKFAVNSADYPDNPWSLSFGSKNSGYCTVNEELDAAYGGKEIFFKVDRDYSTVHIKLDLRDFNFRTKQGARLTVNVKSPDCVLRFKDSDKDVLMNLNEETGMYEYETFYDEPTYGQEFYVYSNGNVYGEADSDKMYYYDVISNGKVKIIFSPETEKINVEGTMNNVLTSDSYTVKTVIAAGNGDGAFLNGVKWNTRNMSNALTETSKGVWEITYENVDASDSYKVKFAVNPFDYSGLWNYCFGSEETGVFKNKEEISAVFGGKNCLIEVEEDKSTVNLKLDLRNFDYRTKQGARLTITVTPPDVYGVQQVNTGVYPGPDEVLMTYNEGSGLYELTVKNAEPQTVDFCLLKNHTQIPGIYGWCSENPISFNVEYSCDVTITLNPLTEEINVLGDGVYFDTELSIISVIAAGNGEGNYLNGANWDPCDTSNTMKEVEKGVFELTMEDVEAYNNYNVKFVVNSVDDDGEPVPSPWQNTFGVPEEKEYPTGELINIVLGGKNCIFSVPQDGSTVTLRLNLRNYDFATNKGAKLLITVEPPKPVQELVGDVNGDGVVDILDAALVQKYAAEKVELSEEQKKIGDVNGDGLCNILDATAIQKSLVN